jgi:hypothetical protein
MNHVVVDRGVRGMAGFGGLNLLHHGGRVPRQGIWSEPFPAPRLRLPRRDGGPGVVAGHDGPWGQLSGGLRCGSRAMRSC